MGELRTEVELLEQKLRKVTATLRAKEADIETLAAQQDTLRSLASVRADRIRELEAEITRRDQTIAELRAELDQASARAADAPDDLRRIRGIGPKFEQKLHELGIERYAQIAAWNDDDVAAMAAQLKVHARRIERDGWVESARQLAADGDHGPSSEPRGEQR